MQEVLYVFNQEMAEYFPMSVDRNVQVDFARYNIDGADISYSFRTQEISNKIEKMDQTQFKNYLNYMESIKIEFCDELFLSRVMRSNPYNFVLNYRSFIGKQIFSLTLSRQECGYLNKESTNRI